MHCIKYLRKCFTFFLSLAMMFSTTLIDVQAIEANQIQAKVDAIIAKMSIEEKVGQMLQADADWISPEDVAKYKLGSILRGGGSDPDSGNSMKSWADDAYRYHQAVMKNGGIPLLYGVDAVHGHNNVIGATIFPHNIGLGAMDDDKVVEMLGAATASEMLATGINWTFTPTVGVPHNERWGRTYEAFGDNYTSVSKLGSAWIKGLQKNGLVIATAKHYIAEGLAIDGKNQGEAPLGDKNYNDLLNANLNNPVVKELLTPYIEAIKNDVKSIMVSYNSINNIKCHGNKQIITDLLKGKLGFKGIVISDYNGFAFIPGKTYAERVENCVNAGVDMLMVADRMGNQPAWKVLYDTMVSSVKAGRISQERMNDAVRRILTVKFELGIMDNPSLVLPSKVHQDKFGSDEYKKLARDTVSKTLVLLKNDQYKNQTMMQLLSNMKNVVVAGSSAHNIGNQCGGWTIQWQGESNNTVTTGTTIYEGIKEVIGNNGTALYCKNGVFSEKNMDAAIVVVGETPYAESPGDAKIEDVRIKDYDLEVINNIKRDHPDLPIVLVLVTGRPLTIVDQIKDDQIKGIVCAWLPGSEGGGVADVLFGNKDFTAKNPLVWPWYASDIDKKYDDASKVLFKYGYGLNKATTSQFDKIPEEPGLIVFNNNTKIEAEDFTSRSPQLHLENNDTTVGWFDKDLYLSYNIKVDKNSVFDVTGNFNAEKTKKNAFKLLLDGKVILENINDIQGMGNWTTFKEMKVGQVAIPKGNHTLKLVANIDGFNVDWLNFKFVKEYIPVTKPENVGTGEMVKEDAVKVSMSSSEKSKDREWYYGEHYIENKNEDKPSLDLRKEDNVNMTTIHVDSLVEYQEFIGMGTSVDESTVNNLWKMDEANRRAFIRRLVDPVNGSGNTLFRLTIGTPDFVSCPFYTYYDGNGKELNGRPDWYNETGKGFTIQKDIDYHIIETIKMIQEEAKACGVEDQIKFFASPWTMPGWMKEHTANSRRFKNNQLLLKGGRLSSKYIQDAGKYYVRYIEEYAKLGIPIYAMTLQNEPLLEIDYPSCLVTPTQEAMLAKAIKEELSKSTILKDSQKDVKVWAFDHNPQDVNDYMNKVYSNGYNYVDGTAVHDYGGQLSEMSKLYQNYHDKTIHLTERSVWGTEGMDRIVQYYRNYAKSYNCWVTMLDSEIKTHQWVGIPDPTAFVQDANHPNRYWATPEVYLMSQFSKYIRPGFVRVKSNYGSSSTITNVVFKNPKTNELVMVAVNNTDKEQDFKVVQGNVQFNATIPAKNCATYIWQAAKQDVSKIPTIPGTLTADDCVSHNMKLDGGNFGYVDAGDYIKYLVNVEKSGYYDVYIEHALGKNTHSEKTVELYNDNYLLGTVKTIDNGQSDWNNFVDMKMRVYLEKGVTELTLKSVNDSINFRNLRFKEANDNIVPGLVNATDYTFGDKVLIEGNGRNVCYVEPGDSFEYDIRVDKTGCYNFILNYAIAAGNTGKFKVIVDGKELFVSNDMKSTSDYSYEWNDYKDSQLFKGLLLSEGNHKLKIEILKGFNLRTIKFVYDNPNPLELNQKESLQLDSSKAYYHYNELTNAVSGSYENYYLDVKDPGKYILSFNISNNCPENYNALTIATGEGLNVLNNEAIIGFGAFYGNTLTYKTIVEFDKVGLYTLQLKANEDFKLTNCKLSSLPSPINITQQTSINPKDLIDGSDQGFWAIEEQGNVGYTNAGAYQDYLVDVSKQGYYRFDLKYATKENNCLFELVSIVDGKEISLGQLSLDNTGSWANISNASMDVKLPKGKQIIRVKVLNSTYNIFDLSFSKKPIVLPEVIFNKDVETYIGSNKTIEELLQLDIKLGNEDITKDAIITSDYNNSAAGNYKVTIKTSDSDGNSIELNTTIIVKALPKIKVQDVVLKVGELFDPLKDVVVINHKGEDITKDVKLDVFSNNVDNSKVGNYIVEYQVTLGDGTIVKYKRNVSVVSIETEPTDPTIPDSPNKPINPDDTTTPDINDDVIIDSNEVVVPTGDNSNISIYVVMALVSVIGVVLYIKGRKKEK